MQFNGIPSVVYHEEMNNKVVGDRSQGQTEGSLFNSYYAEV